MATINRIMRSCIPALLAVATWIAPCTGGAQATDLRPIGTSSDAPKIVFESSSHDFGTAKPKTPLTHDFVFKNEGESALVIQKVKAG